MRTLLALTASFVVGFAPTQAQLAPQQIARIDSVFGTMTRSDAPGCVLGVGAHGKVLYERGYGMSSLEHPTPLSAPSIVEIGSVSKQFTTGSILLLAQDGKLTLEDDVRKWIPELPDFGKKITIRMLANHTSGMRDQWGLLGIVGNPPGTQVHSIPLILDLLSRQQHLNFPPNDQYLYSNSGFVLLATIVRRASGKSLADFSAERIFKPLGMNSTSWRDDHQRVVQGRALAYQPAPGGQFRTEMPFTNVYGNGGLLTTVGDLLLWWDALMNNRLGKPGFTDELTRQAVLNNGRKIAYALGVSVDDYRGVREFSHGGATAGYRAHLAAYPDAKTAIAVLCNRADGAPATLLARVADIVLADRLGPAPTRPVVTAAAVPAEAHASRAGLYRNIDNEELMYLEARPDRLSISRFGGQAELIPVGPDTYRRPNTAQDIRFTTVRGKMRIDRGELEGTPQIFERVDAAAPTPAQLARYAGTYVSPELEYRMQIRVENDALVITRRGQNQIRLTPTFKDGFSANGFYVFTRNAEGRIDGFKYTQGRVRHVRFVKTSDGGT